jgi:hypothetical protein
MWVAFGSGALQGACPAGPRGGPAGALPLCPQRAAPPPRELRVPSPQPWLVQELKMGWRAFWGRTCQIRQVRYACADARWPPQNVASVLDVALRRPSRSSVAATGAFRRHRRTIGDTRIPARRRIFLSAHPPVHPQQRGAQQGIVIDAIERLLAASAVDPVGVGQRRAASGMMRAGEVVKARP